MGSREFSEKIAIYGVDNASDQCYLQQQSQGRERFRLASCIVSIPSIQEGSFTSNQLLAFLRMTSRPRTRRRAADVATVDDPELPEVAPEQPQKNLQEQNQYFKLS